MMILLKQGFSTIAKELLLANYNDAAEIIHLTSDIVDSSNNKTP